jgi:hypothetical protein
MNASSVTPNTAGIESSAKQVGGRDRDEDDEQRRGHRAPAHPGEHPSAGVVVGEGQHPARRTDDRVVLDVGVPVAMAKELDRGREEQRAEDREHEREARDEDGPERDEDRPHDQGDEDAEGGTRCWYRAGTAKVVRITTNTKRLSTERLFSTR